MIDRPFTMGFVLRATAKHMRRAIDISIRKTNARWKDFAEDETKSKEVMMTLMVLHDMRKWLDEFQSENKNSFKEIENGDA